MAQSMQVQNNRDGFHISDKTGLQHGRAAALYV
jgi:hypothetical protein